MTRACAIGFLALAAACASAPADYTETIPGSEKGRTVRFDMVFIPGDGSIRPFWIGKYEVTWDEYMAFASPDFGDDEELPPWTREGWAKFRGDDDTEVRWRREEADAVSFPSRPYEPPDHVAGQEPWGMGRRPVMKLTSRMAREYCKWLTKVTGRPYRLPTEREWEHAAGPVPPGDLGEFAWFEANSAGRMHEVGRKRPNARGLYDVWGNAAEYVGETIEPPREGPWFDDRRPRGVAKGGCWADAAEALRAGARRLEELAWDLSDPERPRSICWHREGIYAGLRVARGIQE
jgi:formylglycine-generating enzyme required for sulfatase activity